MSENRRCRCAAAAAPADGINVFKIGFDEPEIAAGETGQNKIGLAGCHLLFPRRGKSAAHLPAVRALESERTMRDSSTATPTECVNVRFQTFMRDRPANREGYASGGSFAGILRSASITGGFADVFGAIYGLAPS